MLDRIQGLEKVAKIRLIIFIALLIYCTYLGAGYSYELEGRDSISSHVHNSMVDTSDIDDVYIDGSDFTPVVRLLGYGVNGFLSLVYFLAMLGIMILIVVLSLVPTLLLRFVGIRKRHIVTEDEYKFTKYLYFIGIGISLVLSLILTRFVGIVPCILFNAAWALIVLIYVLGVWSRHKAYLMAIEHGIPLEQIPS